MFDLLVIGGGAAGFYGAIHTARMAPGARIAILEQSTAFLSKVRISGGGRCNVTHRPMEASVLASHYPRGHRELIGPFHAHASSEVMSFFEALGVSLKVEQDGRVFPVSDDSGSITGALLEEARRLGIEMIPSCAVKHFSMSEDPTASWQIASRCGSFQAANLLVAPGSSKVIWQLLGEMGYPMVRPVPSLFTFNSKDPRLKGLQGISTSARLEVLPRQSANSPALSPSYKQLKRTGSLSGEGPLLITHWGLSGPAVLRISAWGARYFASQQYRFPLRINWIPEYHKGGVRSYLEAVRQTDPKKTIHRTRVFDLPSRLWSSLVDHCGIGQGTRWGEVSGAQLQHLDKALTESVVMIDGKSTFKDEFVTAGGFPLKQLDFRTFESRKHRGLFLAGEVLDIDAVTGGFNFQNAWTGSYLAACEIASRLST